MDEIEKETPRSNWVNYSLREGDHDQCLNKKVTYLFRAQEGLLVYLDQDDEFQFVRESGFDGVDKDMYNRVMYLQASSETLRGTPFFRICRRLFGEALVQILEASNVEAAKKAVGDAEKYYVSRTTDAARIWFLDAAFFGMAAICLVFLSWWLNRGALELALSVSAFQAITCAMIAGLAACVSIVIRAANITADAAAGAKLHKKEALARIAAGCFFGGLAAVMVKSGFVQQLKNDSFLFMAFVAAASGFSERFMPNMISRVELSADEKLPKKTNGSGE